MGVSVQGSSYHQQVRRVKPSDGAEPRAAVHSAVQVISALQFMHLVTSDAVRCFASVMASDSATSEADMGRER